MSAFLQRQKLKSQINVADLEKKIHHRQIILTINSSVQQLEELVDSSQHLLPGEIQQGNHSEAQLLQQVGQLMHIHDGGHQVRVVGVIQVADK